MREITVRLGDERTRLNEELDGLAERLVDVDDDAASAAMLKNTANEIERRLSGVCYLIDGSDDDPLPYTTVADTGDDFDGYGPDAEITVRGLDAGGYARVQDRAAAMRSQRDKPGDIPGARSNIFAALGLVDAPFLDSNDLNGASDPLDVKLETIASHPLGVVKYIESIANDLTTVSKGNFRNLRERLMERTTSEG